MSVVSEATWRLIKRDYFSARESIADIAKRHGISTTSINQRRKKCGWPTRHQIRSALAASASGAVDLSDLVERIYRLIKLKLEQMEEDMAKSSERTPADNERETRAIGTMIRNIEKAHGIEQVSKNDGSPRANSPERLAEADALSRELADRLVRIREADQQDER